MSLIKCSECGKEVSDKASSCPICGNPLQDGVVTTQATKKRWKLFKLISWLVFIFGLILFSNIIDGGFNNPKAGMGFTLVFIGLIGIIIGKFGAWWANG